MSEIIGLKFGMLTVLKQEGQYKNGTKLFVCKCECGNLTSTSKCHLQTGSVKSCGCLCKITSAQNGKKSKIEIPLGTKFGRLTVECQAVHSTKYGVYWKCLCDCGTYVEIISSNLRRGTSRSCGCLASEIVKIRNRGSRKNSWEVELNNHIAHSIERGIHSELTIEEFTKLSQADCYYCGMQPLQSCKSAILRENLVKKNGIDRIDSKLGYTIGNCVSCCADCNLSKLDKDLQSFYESTKRRFEHLKKKGLI